MLDVVKELLEVPGRTRMASSAGAIAGCAGPKESPVIPDLALRFVCVVILILEELEEELDHRARLIRKLCTGHHPRQDRDVDLTRRLGQLTGKEAIAETKKDSAWGEGEGSRE